MITSVQNPQVKEWKKLHKRKHRQHKQRFLIEGFHLIEEAYASKWNIIKVIVQKGVSIPNWCTSQQIEMVDASVFQEIAQTETPQGIAAVVEMKESQFVQDGHMLLIDAVQDPGNLGTIIRTADAAGFSDIILGHGTVDLYNDKVIRASQGSVFHANITQANLTEVIPNLKKRDYTIWASALEGAASLYEVKVPEKVALILGNEGAGVDNVLLEEADEKVTIPIYGQAESLNVSVAAGIFMYYVRK